MIYLDSEARVDATLTHHPYLAIARYVTTRPGADPARTTRIYTSETEQFDALWDEIAAFACKGQTYIFGHNLFYDLAVLGGIPALATRGWTVTDYYARGAVFTMTFRRGGHVLRALSSTNYYAASLERLGALFGLPKLSVDYQEDDVETVTAYCLRDVDILETAVARYQDFVLRADLGPQAPTLAGQAFRAFRHRFMQHEIIIHDNKEVCALERESYTGGRVECLAVGLQTPRPYHYVDVHSMYPSVMAAHPYPIRLIAHGESLSRAEYRHAVGRGYAITARCALDTSLPAYPRLLRGRLVYPVGTYNTTLSTPEIAHAAATGALVSIGAYALYETAPIFTEYVNYFYERKQSEEDDVLRNFYKLFLNSLYGKFGQRALVVTRLGDADPAAVHSETIVDAVTGARTLRKTLGGSLFEVSSPPVGEEEAWHAFASIAAHVTAYARMHLWHALTIATPAHAYYVDTDAVIVDDRGLALLTAAGCIHPTALGAWGISKSSEILEIRQPKDYTMGTDTRRKGLSAVATPLSPRRWRDVQWPGLDGLLMKGNLQGYQNREIVKELSQHYLKGRVGPDGRVSPLILDHDHYRPYAEDDAQAIALNRRYLSAQKNR